LKSSLSRISSPSVKTCPVFAHDRVEAEAEPKPLLTMTSRGSAVLRRGSNRREAGILPQGSEDLSQEFGQVVDELDCRHRFGRERSLHLRFPASHDLLAFRG